MSIKRQYLKKNMYNNLGYLKVANSIPISLIKQIKKDLTKKNIGNIYYDKKGIIRRSENIYDKSKSLRKLNNIIKKKIYQFFKRKLVIFKDKCNFKPPGGAGFTAHYDGIFYFKNKNNIKKKGWYEYSNYFMNVLIALDNCNKRNGSIEISPHHNQSFEELFLNTKMNGSPELKKKIEKKLKFKYLNLKPGDILFFSNKCPHKSKKNLSKTSRMILYYTYALGNKKIYNRYFKDKLSSKNKNEKSLTG